MKPAIKEKPFMLIWLFTSFMIIFQLSIIILVLAPKENIYFTCVPILECICVSICVLALYLVWELSYRSLFSNNSYFSKSFFICVAWS